MSWLLERLTPYKQSQPRWADLARALETYWDTYNAPALDRIEAMRSVFSADEEDIRALLDEAGIKFEVAVPLVRENRAFAYAWRAYEVHRKDRQATLEQILARDYSGTFVRWMPLYAPRNLPYGDMFLAEPEVTAMGMTRADVHDTYRGKVAANLTGLTASGIRKEAFRSAVRRKVETLRPAHIVYDGEMFFQVFRAEIDPFQSGSTTRKSASHTHLMLALSPYRFDDLAADVAILDHQPLGTLRHKDGRRHHVEAWPAGQPWSLDAGSTVDGDYLPLPGIEGDSRSRVGSLGKGASQSFLTGKITLKATAETAFSLPFDTLINHSFTLAASASAETNRDTVARSAPAATRRAAISGGPRMDDVPADFAPLDMIYEAAHG